MTPRRGGWRRQGRRRFRYVDARGDRITDEARLARIEQLRIPPAWRDVWISPKASARVHCVSPAVVEQWRDGRTLADYRAPSGAAARSRARRLSADEAALLSLLRSWRVRRARAA